eukprot:TRINITY_DN34989_c0_g1_i1.p1 TRINITY_DN34989_c0_g1~~TRINITY_DN34989_c0_g1_i1.p1  ORF type:complete len:161 (-),score=48.80 TRINITY_DN34989_c0_g1_i1:60-542(-)
MPKGGRHAEAASAPAEESSESDDQIVDSGDERAEDDHWGDWAEGDQQGCADLFSAEVLPSAEAMLQRCTEAHQFDFCAYRAQHGLDMYGTIRLINYIRSQVAECGGEATLEKMRSEALPEDFDKESESLLQPVLVDDVLLLHSFDDDEGWSSDEAPGAAP